MKENTKRVISLSLSKPELSDNTADADRLITALKKELGADTSIHMDLDLLRKIPELLRRWDYEVRCMVFRERKRHILLGLTSAQENRTAAGLAVDLGTTRVVLRLLDLVTEEVLGETAFNNPQIAIAPDILARIHFADAPGGLEKLQQMVIAELNNTVSQLCASCQLTPEDIYLITLAGNTAMTHLFMGITPHWMIREPYIPAVNCPGLLRTAELGIAAGANARIFLFPNVGSYFGGDLIAGILYSGMSQKEETAILVDVGTNAEVILGCKDWLVACAGAAGPALESGVARMGMMAAPGVIDTMEVDRKTRAFRYRTIEDLPPKGMCGSGIIDLAAQLFLSGMLDIRGKLVPEKCGDRLIEKDGMPFIVVVPAAESASGEDLGMSQADIDSLIRSKAAMYTILGTLTRTVGMKPEDLQTFYVAGTFGSFIKPPSAIAIGMIPDLPLERYKPLGNSSLGGAAMALTMENCMEETEKIRSRITYIELNVNQELMIRFSASRFLPHTDPARFPSVKVWG
ncbi:MAG: ASKHA domain-containing protein [Desulfobacterales bacterium]